MKSEDNNIPQQEIVIDLENVYKSFGNNHVLQGITLQVARKENVVVLGRSGTGKSVLIKIISGLLKPDRGTVIVLDKEVDKLNDKELQALRLADWLFFPGKRVI